MLRSSEKGRCLLPGNRQRDSGLVLFPEKLLFQAEGIGVNGDQHKQHQAIAHRAHHQAVKLSAGKKRPRMGFSRLLRPKNSAPPITVRSISPRWRALAVYHAGGMINLQTSWIQSGFAPPGKSCSPSTLSWTTAWRTLSWFIPAPHPASS